MTNLKRNGETVFVTGAAGYVGSAVVDRLLEHGYAVKGLSRNAADADGLRDKGVAAVVGDAGDGELIAKETADAAAIVHTAAPNDPTQFESMEAMIATTAQVLETLVKVAQENNAKLLATSGTSVYGHTQGQTVDETAPLQAMPGTQVLKHLEARLIQEGAASFIRLGVVFGRSESAPMRNFVEALRKRGRLAAIAPVHRLSVVQVDDLADLYLAILEAENPPQVLNAVSEVLPWSEVVGAIGQSIGISGEVDIITPQDAMMMGGPAMFMPIDMGVSSNLARSKLGWEPKRPGFREHFSKGS